jgi:mannan endo-1,4-beta-mannosidase
VADTTSPGDFVKVDIVVLTPTLPAHCKDRSAPIVEGAFVARQGSQLMLAGCPFRFVGTNAYFLQPEMAYGNATGVTETLDRMVELGMSVVRMWAFNDGDPVGDPAVIQIEPGVYNEENLVALDRVIAEAKRRDIRLILTLVNYFRDYGGVPRYIEWCACNASTRDFYTNEQLRRWYRDYVSMLVNRVNTITGIAYRDEPAILAWELGNELRNPGGNVEDWLAWHAEMAAYIKSLDPNHLVADGGEGFDNDANLYPDLSNAYAVRGGEGVSFHRLAKLPDIDMVSIHLYPASWGLNDDSDVETWIRVHAKLAQQNGKVIYLGEYGMKGDDGFRARTFDRWLTTALIDYQLAGAMVWGLVYKTRPDYDDFSIYCPTQVETCSVLRQHASNLMMTSTQ